MANLPKPDQENSRLMDFSDSDVLVHKKLIHSELQSSKQTYSSKGIDLPRSFDWREVDYQNYLFDVIDQVCFIFKIFDLLHPFAASCTLKSP